MYSFRHGCCAIESLIDSCSVSHSCFHGFSICTVAAQHYSFVTRQMWRQCSRQSRLLAEAADSVQSHKGPIPRAAEHTVWSKLDGQMRCNNTGTPPCERMLESGDESVEEELRVLTTPGCLLASRSWSSSWRVPPYLNCRIRAPSYNLSDFNQDVLYDVKCVFISRSGIKCLACMKNQTSLPSEAMAKRLKGLHCVSSFSAFF